MKSIPSFIDFEASSLDLRVSYPIEVAWNLGESIEEHLISPQSVARWTDWSAKSAAIHGIPRAQLLAQGKPPAWVCRRLNEQLKDRVVYSDNAFYDAYWLAELFSAAAGTAPTIRIGAFDDLIATLFEALEPTTREYAGYEFEERIAALKENWTGWHRAGRDVAYLLQVYLIAESVIENFSA